MTDKISTEVVRRGNTNPSCHFKDAREAKFWCMTIWVQPPGYDDGIMDFLAYGKEICPTTKRVHYQSFVCLKKAKSLLGMTKLFGKGNHYEQTRGSFEDNIKYCSKDGDYISFGSLPERKGRGFRSDLIAVKDEILNGKKLDDVAITDPNLYHMYGRTLTKIEDLCMRKKFRNTMTQGFWYWGKTGVGKSHKAFEGFSPETHYVVPLNDKGWWDGYCQQDTVVLNDFRGQLTYSDLLNLVDKWPHSVPRRGREPMPFISKKVIITSSLPPEDVYHKLSSNDSLDQLKRRFVVEEVLLREDGGQHTQA